MQTVTTETETAANDNQVTRLRNYARGERGGSVQLEVYRSKGSVVVGWNVNRGASWRAKGWKKTCHGAVAESEALAFVPGKWEQLVAWLEALEPEQGSGAADAFSAQVATMR